MRTNTLSWKVISRLASTGLILAIATILFSLVHPVRPAFAVIPIAGNDDFSISPINGFTGGSTTTVFVNDTLSGATVTSATVTTSIANPGTLTGVGIDADGLLTIPAHTPAGTYVVTYQICEVVPATPTPTPTPDCATADATVLVTAPVISAATDDFSTSPINGVTGGTTATVFTNDRLNLAAIDPGDVTESIIGSVPPLGVGITGSGALTIPAGTAANTYTVTYQICEVTNTTNCATATATVVVVQITVNALDDDFSASPINGTAGGSTGTVFTNDTLNGVAVTSATVTTSIANPVTLLGVGITGGGAITVPPGTANGTYTVTYQICETGSTTNCDTAIATVVVGQRVIIAVNDDFSGSPINGVAGGSTTTVFSNDTLGGSPVVSAAVSPSITDAGTLTGVGITASGTLTIPRNAAANIYTVTYQICEAGNLTNCDTATAIVHVITINAVNNNFSGSPINGATGGSTATVFSNDTLNGARFANSAVSPSIADAGGLTGVTINTNGTLTVPRGRADNIYTVIYRICQAGSTTNCDTANVIIRIGVDPSITKSRSRSSAVPSDTIVYTIVVKNPRTTSLTNVEVTDQLDDLVDYVSSTTTRGTRSYSSTTDEVTFAVGTMTAGQTVTLTITVRVISNPTRPSTIENVATIDSTQTGAIDSNTVSVSIPAASTSPTATPRPTSTPTTPTPGTPGQLPNTGEQPEPDMGILWAILALLGIALALLVGLAMLVIKPGIIGTYHRISRWVGLGLLLAILAFAAFVVFAALRPSAEQVAEVSPAPPSLETTDQPPVFEALLGLIPSQPSATPTPIPEAQSPDTSPAAPVSQTTHIVVPALNLDTDLVEMPIVDGKWDASQLAMGVAHLETTAYPGTKGNVVLAGHVLTKRGIGPFYDLQKMDTGDTIIAERSGVTYIYRVEWVKVVSPSDIDVASPADTPVMTLLTCIDWNSETREYDSRLAVRARLVDTIREKLSETDIQ